MTRSSAGWARIRLTGGDGSDRFVFNAPGDSPAGSARDVIKGFDASEDYVDLSVIGVFTFIGNDAFDGAGQVRFSQGRLQVNVAVDGSDDDRPEMQIALSNVGLGDLDAATAPDWLL